MDAAPPGLTVDDLSCARGGVPVLSGVGFAVPAGQALVLRGPNGAGKTTLLRTLAGLQPALGGHVSLSSDAMVQAGHADAVKATLTVAENLTFWARVFGTGGISSALDAMDLTALADRPGGQLSAGQRRRLGLARLWVSGRRVWLLDEPTVSLDAASVALFARGVAAHLGQGGIAIVATHADIGLPQAAVLDLAPFRARADAAADGFDAAFG